MKSAVRPQLSLLFAALGLLALVTCWLVLAGTRQSARQHRQLALVMTFQLQVKELQLLASRLESEAADLSPIITDAQSLAREVEALGGGGDSWAQGWAASPTLSSQLESIRQAYLDLATLQGEKSKLSQSHPPLLDLVDQRVAALSPERKAQLKPRLDTFHRLHGRIHQERNRQALPPLQALGSEVMSLVADDSALIETMNRLLTETAALDGMEEAIEKQQELLDRLAAAFARTAKSTADEISLARTREQARLHSLALLLFTTLGGAILLAYLCSRRALDSSLTTLRQAVALLRPGHPADQAPAENGSDEPALARHWIEEAAAELQGTKRALSAAHRRFEEFTATLQDWVWMVDPHGICTYSRKPSTWQAIDLDDRQAVGQPWEKILEGPGEPPLVSDLLAALAKQAPFTAVVTDWHLANGKTISCETSGRPLQDSAGQFQGFILISRDISHRLRTETELAKVWQANSFLNQVLELALLDIKIPELMDRFLKLLTDCSWLGAQTSAAFFLIDRSRSSLVLTAQRGLDLDIQRSCAVLPLGTCLCGRSAQTGKVIFAESGDDRHEISYHGMALHGHYCLPVHTVAGEIIGVVVLYLNPDCKWEARDESILTSATTMIGSIIRRRQAEDRLKELNQDLERRIDSRTAQLTAANKELDAFAYSVSHDLRAPLRAIDGFSQALAEDFGSELPAEAHGYLERIRAGCGRMGSLINDLLRLSRLTRGDLDWQTLDLSKIAREISKEIGAESPQRMVEWRIAPNLMAEGDPTMIRAVLDNLLGNAWKYSAKTSEARIEFGLVHLDQEDAFFVKDNGAGFDMRYADKLFKAFQRLHSASQFAGNGIGLATVQRIIHRHGGRIWAHGQVDQGATFTFTLGRPEPKG